MQAEKVRVLYAEVGLVKLPDNVADEQAILLFDIFPTAYFGADLAEIEDGDTVAVFGCGPVGIFTILNAKLLGAGRVIAVDRHQDRLEMAKAQGAEVINFDQEDPIETILRLTGGIGVDRVIDAVGVDAQHADHGPAAEKAQEEKEQFEQQLEQVAPEQNPDGDTWVPGNAPFQALEWAVEAVAKAGTISIIGVYPPTMQTFPIGQAMNKNLTLKMGNCNHRKYIPELVDLVASGVVDPVAVLTQMEPRQDALAAYKAFDERQPGWIKVELEPTPA